MHLIKKNNGFSSFTYLHFFSFNSICEPTPFEILNIPATANLSDIKKAYFKLSKIYHPDINKSKDANEKFKEINKAYNILKEIHGEKTDPTTLYSKHWRKSNENYNFYERNKYNGYKSSDQKETQEQKIYRNIFGKSYKEDPMEYYKKENEELRKKYDELIKNFKNKNHQDEKKDEKSYKENENKNEFDENKKESKVFYSEKIESDIPIHFYVTGFFFIGIFIITMFAPDSEKNVKNNLYFSENKKKTNINNSFEKSENPEIEELREKNLSKSKEKIRKIKENYLKNQKNMKYYPLENDPNAIDLLVDYSIFSDLKLYYVSSAHFYTPNLFIHEKHIKKNKMKHLRINSLLSIALEAERSFKHIYIQKSKLKEILEKDKTYTPPAIFIRFFGYLYIKIRNKPIIIDNLLNDQNQWISLFDLYFRYSSPIPIVHEDYYEFPIYFKRYIPDTTTHEGSGWLGNVTLNHRKLKKIYLNGDEKNVFVWTGQNPNSAAESRYIRIWNNFYDLYAN